MRPDAGHEAKGMEASLHYLWRGPMYVKHNGDVYPCCQSYMLDGQPLGRVGAAPLGEIWNSEEMQRMRRLHVADAPERSISARAAAHNSASGAGGGQPPVSRQDRAAGAAAGGASGVLSRAPKAMLTPPKLVQISGRTPKETSSRAD